MKGFKSMYYFAEEESKTDETTLILIGRVFFFDRFKNVCSCGRKCRISIWTGSKYAVKETNSQTGYCLVILSSKTFLKTN